MKYYVLIYHVWKSLSIHFVMQNGPSSERKIVKLCEYAAKNPFRIPKIAQYLEERCFKELRCDHIKFVNIVTEAYNKLLCICKEQMAYFAVSLLNVVNELLDNSKKDAVQLIGCQTLTSNVKKMKRYCWPHDRYSCFKKYSKKSIASDVYYGTMSYGIKIM
ncbi:hypothetical protein CsSME_00010607 [Camellia sinensis var. sinensis]